MRVMAGVCTGGKRARVAVRKRGELCWGFWVGTSLASLACCSSFALAADACVQGDVSDTGDGGRETEVEVGGVEVEGVEVKERSEAARGCRWRENGKRA